MSCEECEAARRIDGDIPACETEKGCIIPPLGETGARIMAIREKLVTLKNLVDPGTILVAYGVTRDDLEMLAKVEQVMNALKPKGTGNV